MVLKQASRNISRVEAGSESTTYWLDGRSQREQATGITCKFGCLYIDIFSIGNPKSSERPYCVVHLVTTN